jgi:hypothetical protein
MPVFLCPHGHWSKEDLHHHGRHRDEMQYRCGALARMGCGSLLMRWLDMETPNGWDGSTGGILKSWHYKLGIR